MSKIIVGISGGVDSAYTLYLLKSQGHEAVALYLNMLGGDDSEARRCAEEADADYICIDCRELFSEKVKEYFKNEYACARTPNPCVVCNRDVKLKLLYDTMLKTGADSIATGHYAKVYYDEASKRYGISVSDDTSKDQSYMLWMLGQDVLSRLTLPLGDKIKSELRKDATTMGLSSAGSKDSTDICFVPDGDHAQWLEKNGITMPDGCFVHADGRVLGTSKPIYNYTIGQRRGLGLAMDRSVFVTGIDADKSVVTVDYEEGLYKNEFCADNLNFVGAEAYDLKDKNIFVKIRYRSKPQRCLVDLDGGICTVKASDGESFKAPAPGQSAVFYDEHGHILFGGLICR